MTAQSPIWWAGPICGLGNRIMALAAVRACAGDRPVRFIWSNDDSCPGDYEDVFIATDLFAPAEAAPDDARVIQTGWEPYEIFESFKKELGLDFSRATFSARLIAALDGSGFHEAHLGAAKSWRAAQGETPLAGIHVRRTDRTAQHRQQFRDFLMRKSGLNRELPVLLTALYGLAPSPLLRAYENAHLTSALRGFCTARSECAFAVFADDEFEAQNVENAIARSAPKALRRKGPDSEPLQHLQSLRRTSLSGAMADLLCLSKCDAIAQSNRASTFSLVAAMIGRRPILTAKSRYPFWLKLEEDLGAAPNALPLTRPLARLAD